MKKRAFDVALFDIDGTILDTRKYIFRAYKHTMKHHFKKNITWKDLTPTLGLPLKDCYRLLTGLQDVEELMLAHDQFQYQNLDLITAYPNTLALLEALRKRGIAVAAVTNRYAHIQESLKRAKIDKYFEVIITPLDVKNPKPDAESVFKALECLGVTPDRAVLIGDSPADILAGKNAKTKTIGALYGFHGQRLLKLKPDYTVNDIQQILPIILGHL